jgi:hypothetical protein
VPTLTYVVMATTARPERESESTEDVNRRRLGLRSHRPSCCASCTSSCAIVYGSVCCLLSLRFALADWEAISKRRRCDTQECSWLAQRRAKMGRRDSMSESIRFCTVNTDILELKL